MTTFCGKEMFFFLVTNDTDRCHLKSEVFIFSPIGLIYKKNQISIKIFGTSKKMDRQDDDAIKQAAREKAREKFRKKREQEKEMKIFKETNVEFQKQINTTRQHYGMDKKKNPKNGQCFFWSPPPELAKSPLRVNGVRAR